MSLGLIPIGQLVLTLNTHACSQFSVQNILIQDQSFATKAAQLWQEEEEEGVNIFEWVDWWEWEKGDVERTTHMPGQARVCYTVAKLILDKWKNHHFLYIQAVHLDTDFPKLSQS